MGELRFDEADDDTSSSLETEGKRRNVEKEKVLSLLRGFTGEDGGLDGRTIGYSLIRFDALVGLLAVGKVGNKFDDTSPSKRARLRKVY